jgi:radical SAM protein with 4Fe4S-binding SPASM domain
MPLSDYEKVIRQASRLGVLQVALGGGNPNQHPDFIEILRITREEYGIVPNYTTNGKGLRDEILQATATYCGALAVSAYHPFVELAGVLQKVNTHGIKVNIHFILDSVSVETALAWLLKPPAFLSSVNAIIFLNYKPIGRVCNPAKVLRCSTRVQAFLEAALGKRRDFKIGFDSCMVSGLASIGIVDPIWFDACEAARFSMYVSETMRAYPCSFMEPLYEGVPLTGGNLLEIWQEAPLFQQIRKELKHPPCQGGSCVAICRGGCPIFPEINLCQRDAGEKKKEFANVESMKSG